MPVKVGLHYIEIWKDSMEKKVREYESEETPKDQIIFYGPSYFTRWSEQYGMKPLRECILGASGAPCCVNRGFGSSCSEHQLYYYPRMVRPYEPRVLVYSSNGNGLSFGYTVEEIWELAQRVIAYTAVDFPETRIYLCGTNRSRDEAPERTALWERYDEWQREYAATHANCFFIDTRAEESLRRKDIYVADGVHYNREGYDLYAEFFRKALAEELKGY